MTFVAGAFKWYYSPAAVFATPPTYADIGETESGLSLRHQYHNRPIHTDRGGDSIVDAVQRGSTFTLHCPKWLDYTLIKAVLAAHNPVGKVYDNVGKLLGSSLSGPLVAVPKVGTTSETEVGANKCIVFYKAIVATDVEEMLANDVRGGPMTFFLFPDSGTSDKVYESGVNRPVALSAFTS